MSKPPIGQRFSHVYIERGQPARDSQRFRNRVAEHLAGFVGKQGSNCVYRLAKALERELGVEIDNLHQPEDVIRRGTLRDALDAITVAHRYMRDEWPGYLWTKDWLPAVARVMAEENVGYTVDPQGGVHFQVDKAFEQSRASAVAALQHPDLAAAAQALDDAYRHLDGSPMDTKAAVRSVFEAVEIVARLICPETKNMNRWLAENTLKELCLSVMPPDATEQRVSAGVFSSLADWVDTLHNYRHGQAVSEPIAPSESLAVYALSSGSAYARTLGECYQRLLPVRSSAAGGSHR